MKVGDIVQFKGVEATVIRIDGGKIAKILIKATGESRYVRIEDLLIESEKK